MKEKKNFQKIGYIIIIAALFLLSHGFSSMISGSNFSISTNQDSVLTKDNPNIINNFNQNESIPKDSSSNSDLYSGIQPGIGINETASLVKDDDYIIGNGINSTYSQKNATFFIDDTHNWEANRYNTSITDITDERDWIINGNFGTNENLIANASIYDINESTHPYANLMNPDPTIPADIIATFDGHNSDYIRIHFTQIITEPLADYVCLYDQNNNELKKYCGTYNNIYTPWFNVSQIKITLSTNAVNKYYGFYSDFYEIYNGSMIENWTYYSISSDNLIRSYGSMDNESNAGAVYTAIEGQQTITTNKYSYNNDDESGFFQTLNIPRGEVTNAWVSFDYYMEYGIDSNDFNIFIKINNQLVYSKGFQTISEMGKNKWYSTGLIPLSSWQNSSNVFLGDLNDNPLNISFGIRSMSSVSYTNFADGNLQKVYFDNVIVSLQARANSSQNDINLRINGDPVKNTGNSQSANNGWGFGSYDVQNTWTENPVNFTLSTDSPELEFNLLSNLYVTHYIASNSTQNGIDGVLLSISTNGSITWEFYHNVWVPPGYQNFEFNIDKPINWIISDVKDPTGISIPFSGGNYSEDFLSVNQSYAYFPGWWNFKAESSNMLMKDSTYLWNGTSWQNLSGADGNRLIYNVDNTINIKTALNTSQVENNQLTNTWGNLSIYQPNGSVWYTQSVHPDQFGNINFSNLTVGALNTSRGIYTYKVIWTNGTDAGGINGTFEIRHSINYSVIYPRDAVKDLFSEKSFGEIVPIRIAINDSDNGELVPNIDIQYNWTGGVNFLNEISAGIYDGSLDTSNLLTAGMKFIHFNITGIGICNSSFTLQLYLMQDTQFKLINYDTNIELGSNFSVMVEYKTSPSNIGITGGKIELNMSHSAYTVTPDSTNGIYLITISTRSFSDAGYHEFTVNASKTNYISQSLPFRILIQPISVDIKIFMNSQNCTLNKSYNVEINSNLNLSAQIFSESNALPISFGSVLITDGNSFEKSMNSNGNSYYSVINSSELGLGIHYLSLIFNKTNYQTSSTTIQLTVRQKIMNVTLYDSKSTILKAPKQNFNVTFYLADSTTDQPILNGDATYSWIFGTGIITKIGNGYYSFNGTVPSQSGTYEIQIAVSSGSDYQIAIMKITLVSQEPAPTPLSLLWILIPIGILVFAFISLIIKQNYINPKRARKLENLKKKTQIFDDITNIRGLLVIQKSSGLLMYKQILSGLDPGNEELLTGFLQGIMLFTGEMTKKKKPEHQKTFKKDLKTIDRQKDLLINEGNALSDGDDLEFTHENFNVLVVNGQEIRVALILEGRSSSELRDMVRKFIHEFEGIYNLTLKDWNGDLGLFYPLTPKLVEEIFKLSYLKDFTLSENVNRAILEKKYILSGTASESTYRIIKTLYEDETTFKLKTIISLTPESDKLQAKDIILRFIKNGLIKVASSELMKSKQIEKRIQEIAQKQNLT